ncbi:hypothetical protein DMC63_01555 [Streptomyces sp. WAC 05977]|nr:hypothetical protein DMC63_01555 [Streptomyces sp. WAC 05977]
MQASRKLRQIRTGDYPLEARERLGNAVAKARIAGGWQYRTDLSDAIKAAGGKVSPRSLQALETADASVGQAVLWDVARQLPGWDEDTPRSILEGGPIPPTQTQPVTEEPREDPWSAGQRAKWRSMTGAEIVAEGRRIRDSLGIDHQVMYLEGAHRERGARLTED